MQRVSGEVVHVPPLEGLRAWLKRVGIADRWVYHCINPVTHPVAWVHVRRFLCFFFLV